MSCRILFECANVLKERPIRLKVTAPEEGVYVCPNDIFQARATSIIPASPFREDVNIKKRLALVQGVTNSFWQKMVRSYFPSLLVRQKWHTSRRNVLVGDVVLIQYSDAIRGEWKMGTVSKAEPSPDDGAVRKSTVKYKQKLQGLKFKVGFTTIKRPVQKLVILVPVDENTNDVLDGAASVSI